MSGPVSLAVHPQLPVEGVDLILRIALRVAQSFLGRLYLINLVLHRNLIWLRISPLLFQSVQLTCAQSKKIEEVVDISNSFLVNDPDTVECVLSVTPDPDTDITSNEKLTSETPLKAGREAAA